jgi:hypothetical protein
MNRKDFLERLIGAYPNSFFDYVKDERGVNSKTPKKEVFKNYTDTLPTDYQYYDRAWLLILKENMNNSAPSPAQILSWMKKAKPIETYKRPEKVAEPIPAHCLQTIEELRKKYRLRKLGGSNDVQYTTNTL